MKDTVDRSSKAPDGVRGRILFGKTQRAGLIMIGVGIFTAVASYGYGLGTVTRVGPGFFPVVLGIVLALIGVAIMLGGEGDGIPAELRIAHEEVPPLDVRGCAAIVAAILLFMFVTPKLGLVPGTFISVFVAAMGDRTMGLARSALLAGGVSLAGSFLFGWALKIGLPFFGS